MVLPVSVLFLICSRQLGLGISLGGNSQRHLKGCSISILAQVKFITLALRGMGKPVYRSVDFSNRTHCDLMQLLFKSQQNGGQSCL